MHDWKEGRFGYLGCKTFEFHIFVTFCFASFHSTESNLKQAPHLYVLTQTIRVVFQLGGAVIPGKKFYAYYESDNVTLHIIYTALL